MGVELIPSITATSAKELARTAIIAQQLSSIVHLDIMDGRFVTTTSAPIKAYSKIKWASRVDIHAMVKTVDALRSILDIIRPRLVYLQVENGRFLGSMIAILRQKKIPYGLAIKPTTPISRYALHLHNAGSILVLAVHPGRYHAPLQSQVFTRVKKIHRRFPTAIITVDGGMNATTITRAIDAGAQRIIVGSAVMFSTNPRAAWRNLRSLTNRRRM